jgi:hypothetical protein
LCTVDTSTDVTTCTVDTSTDVTTCTVDTSTDVTTCPVDTSTDVTTCTVDKEKKCDQFSKSLKKADKDYCEMCEKAEAVRQEWDLNVSQVCTCSNNIFSNNELISNRFAVFVTCTHILTYL